MGPIQFKNCIFRILCAFILLLTNLHAGEKDSEIILPVIQYVDPFIGTGGLGYDMANLGPGPQAPHGLLKLGPDTSILGVEPLIGRPAGYYYPDRYIRGFSHTHFQGTGVEDYGNILFMPVIGISNEKVVEKGYSSLFSHKTELAEPGYYSVILNSTDVRVELTATHSSGFHRYNFHAGDNAYLVINVSHTLTPDACADSYVEIEPERHTVNGWIINKGSMSGRFGGYTLYFAAVFKNEFKDFGVFNEGVIISQGKSQRGTAIGCYAGFNVETGAPVLVKVGISFISMEQAELNLQSEIQGWDFDGIRSTMKTVWEKEIQHIQVLGGTEEQKKIFYTALYHLRMMPTNFTESGGNYRGFDNNVHEAVDFTYYSDMSLWDTFRTYHPLLALIDPQRQRDMVVSLIKMFEQGGDLPKWPMATGYTGCMIGTSADIVIADTFVKGIQDFDIETAYQGMRLHATEPRPHDGRDGLEYYINNGYCPVDLVDDGPSKTLEYGYCDWAIAQVADSLGYIEDRDIFLSRSRNYRNIWFDLRKFFRGRNLDGTWYSPFIPTYPFDEEFTEGDAWHWNWSPQYDVNGLMELFGSGQAFTRKLEDFFTLAASTPNTLLPDPYYWHGNEPDIHSAYLFNYAGRPDLTQKWVRWIMDTKYGIEPNGLDGNDDGGTLSAWYIFSAMGFYPIPGSKYYIVGSPVFKGMKVKTTDSDLIVEARNYAPQNIYVSEVWLNDIKLKAPFFKHKEIAHGGTLIFYMSPVPVLDAFDSFNIL